jgi:peptide/nickel transport system substrate-binding protein
MAEGENAMAQDTYWIRARMRALPRRRILGAGAAALSLGVVACGKSGGANQGSPASGGSGQADKPHSGGKVSVRMANDPFDWDMSFAGKSIPNDYGQSLAYDSLLGFKHGTGISYDAAVLSPQLAVRWETPDAATYTFQLRQGVKFAPAPPVNGRELTSADIKWSYEYWSRTGSIKDAKLPPSQYASYFEGISGIQAPDPYTVVVQFSKPFVPFINYTGSYFNPIVPHEIFDLDGNLQNRIAGTGPWQLDAGGSQKGSRWVWKRNPNYWDTGRPYVDEVDWLILPDQASANTALETKRVDILGASGDAIAAISASQLQKSFPAALHAEYLPVGTSLYLNINTKMAPVKDARVRQAMSFALDRDEFVKTFSLGRGGWALSGAFPDTFTQDEIKQLLRYDPAEAKQLLSAAGYANGVEVEFIYPGTAYGQDYVSALQLLQAQLKKVGINLTLKSMDKDAWTNNRKTYSFVMTGSAKGDLVGDVDSWLYDFHSGNKSNYSQTSDPQLDALIDGQRQEVDAAKRKDLIRQAVRLIAEQAYSLSVWTGNQFQFWQPTLRGYAPNFGVNMVPQTDTWRTTG